MTDTEPDTDPNTGPDIEPDDRPVTEPGTGPDIEIAAHAEEPTAGVREQVPMVELTEFFSRAFESTMRELQAQGISPTGAPFGKYHGQPGDTVDVEAGFPVASAITPAGPVVPGTLPGGRVVTALHTGPYDTMQRTYAAVERHLADAEITTGTLIWESYLRGPELEPDPEKWRTLICWPISAAEGPPARRR